MPTRLNLDTDEHFPVQTFFNAVDDASFLSMLSALSKKTGFSVNDADCSFPSDLDPDEEPFEGVRFSVADESAVICWGTLLIYIRAACEQYLSSHPDERPAIRDILEQMEKHRS